jgi:hypothetical protein
MPHPLHFHGQRFLVVRENGRPTLESLVWRDTYLIGRGYTVDILLDASNPGDWMFHCHIAEHLEDDMMAHFRVVDGGSGGPRPYEWSLGLPWAGIDSLRGDTSLAVLIPSEFAGKVSPRPNPAAAAGPSLSLASALDGKLYLANADFPGLHAEVPFDTAGRFSLSADAILGLAEVVRLKAWVKARGPDLRPVPDTMRLALDRRGKIPWSLDLDLAGEASFAGIRSDTSAVSSMQGRVAGKVNGYDQATMRDSLYFRNMVYPDMFANAPLGPDGSFAFDAADLVGALDGRHELVIFLRPRTGSRRFDPDTLRVHLSIP